MSRSASLRLRLMIAALAIPVALPTFAFAQTNGVWNVNANGNWSASGSWLDGNIADGAGSIADFSQFDITSNRNATIDTTSRTIGTLLFGDSTGPSFSNYTINASGGGTLTFDNGGSGAIIIQGVNSGANTISAPVFLADSLTTNNNSASLLTVSGAISASTAGTKTITNQGTGDGGVTLSGIIGNGSGSVAIVQNSATSTLTLSGANTFNTGVEIKQGTLLANNASALGTGTVLLGDTSGSANATLAIGSATPVNNITVQAGSTGTLTLSNNGTSAARPTGNILLNNDLTITAEGARTNSNQGSLLTASGEISGTGDLNLNVIGITSTTNNSGNPQMDNLVASGAVTTSGEINNIGTGEGRALISGNISNASSVNQNSATSMLTLSGTNTYTGNTNVIAGILRINNTASLPSTSLTTVYSGGTLQLGTNVNLSGTQPLTISGHGTHYSSGALESTNTATYSGAILLAADSTVGSTLGNTNFTFSGPITGSGRTLTTTGSANHIISGNISTGAGGLIKEGTGTTTLSGTNDYTGVTRINNGALLVSSAGALAGGGSIAFNGGTIRHSATNELDYGSRIAGSTGPIAIDTNSRNITYSDIAAGNTGGLTKLGAGRLTLSGTNSFTGPIVVNTGALTVSTTTAIPSIGTGQIFVDSNGALNTGGAYANVQAWLDSDNISTASTGVIALTGNSAEAIDFTGYDSLGLGATANLTYTGTLTAASGGYRLGGGGSTLTLSGTDALTGASALAINGNVTLTSSNDLAGATSISSGTLALGTGGSLAGSAITIGSGATLAITTATSGSPVTRAASATLTGGALTLTGNSAANSDDIITNALTFGTGGNSTISLTQSNARNVRLTADELVRNAGATALIRGTSLGVNSLASQTATSTNIQLATPNLVGGAGANTTDGGIFVGVVGDTSAGGTGFGATGGLLTYDTTNGVRLLSGSEYKTSIGDGQNQLDNIRLGSAAGTVTTTLNSDTAINSLSFALTGTGTANVAINGTGKLTINSGVIYSNSTNTRSASNNAFNQNTISNEIDFNDREAVILVGGGNGYVNLAGILSNTDGKGLTIHAPGRGVILSGSVANIYTGTTTINGGTLTLSKTAGTTAITGDVIVNAGATLSLTNANQIADTANITVNGGSLNLETETFNDLTLNGGSATNAIISAITVAGVTTIGNGGTLTLVRSQNTAGNYDSTVTLGNLNITNTSSGNYTPIAINHGVGIGQSGGKLILGGDVTFAGNATNTNTVLIDAIKGSGRQGVIELTAAAGNRTFNIGDGAAATDLAITAALLDGAGGASGLVKTGAGTLAIFGDNTYTGPTTISAGTLALGASHRLADTGQLVMNGGTFATRGFSETLGTLSLTVSSTIDLGSGASALAFADSSGIAWGESIILNFINFTDGVDSIRFGLDQDGIEASQLAMIRINGSAASIDSAGYLGFAPIPEPSAYAALAGAASLLLALRRRRRAA